MIGSHVGPYTLDAELGSGGMGTVYRATGPRGVVALKVVHGHLATHESQMRRFLREAELGRRVRHANVTSVLDAGEAEVAGRRVPWLALELAEGQTLRALLAEMDRVPEELCRHLGREILRGLHAIHEAGIVHRDLKPENVLVTPAHEVKLMDLGLARLLAADSDSESGMFLGTAAYAAPEQFSPSEEADARADLYSLGVVLYELACGVPPFAGDDLRALALRVTTEAPRRLGERNPQVSPFLEEFVHQLLAKSPAARFASAAEALTALTEGEASEWWTDRTFEIRISTHRPVRRIRVPRETAIYGRDAERERLRRAWDEAAEGRAQVVLLEGEAGIGKSRLADELIAALEQESEDAQVLVGSWPLGGAATATGAFLAAFREHVGPSDVEDAVAGLLPETPALVPAVAAVLRGDAPPPDTPVLDREKLQTAFVHMTRSLAAHAPVLLLVEDLHFAPQDGRALFAALAAGIAGHRVLLVGTLRPAVCDAWAAEVASLGHAARITLPRLGPRELVRLLGDALRSEPLAEELAARIALKSDGNPYYVFEILRGLRESGTIARRADGTWATTRRVREILVPDSVRDLIEARLADLGDDDLEILRVASCAGFSFDPLLVGAVVGMGPLPVLKRLGSIELRHRLVRSAGRRIEFDHHQVQEVLFAGLSDVHRETYHGALADALEVREDALAREPADLPGELATALADHFLRARRGYRALRYLDRALLHLDRSYAVGAALTLLELALDAPGLLAGVRRVDLQLRYAAYLDIEGRRDEQRAALDAAVALADATGDAERRVTARVRLSHHHYVLGLSGPAEQAVASEATAIARAAGLVLFEADALHALGNLDHNAGRIADARAHWQRCREIAVAAGDWRREATAMAVLGLACVHEGRFDEGLSLFERHREIARERKDLVSEAIAAGNIGYALVEMGRSALAVEHYRFQADAARALGSRRLEMYALGNLGIVEQVSGRFAAATALYERQIALTHEIRDARSRGVAQVNLAALHMELGATDRARALFEEALAGCRAIDARHPQAFAEMGLGWVARVTGDFEAADRWYATALAARRAMGYRPGVVQVLHEIGRLRRAQGRHDEARAVFREVLGICRELKLAGQTELTLCHLAQEDPEAAREAAELLPAETSMTRSDRLEALFLLHRATGERSHLVAAKQILDALLAHAPPEHREPMMRDHPVHRALLEAARAAGL